MWRLMCVPSVPNVILIFSFKKRKPDYNLDATSLTKNVCSESSHKEVL